MVEKMTITSKNKVSLRGLERTIGFLEELLSEKDKKVLTGFRQSMLIAGNSPVTKNKNLKMVLRLTRILNGKEWSTLDKDGMLSLVAEFMDMYSNNGRETNTTVTTKKGLQLWWRFLKTGYRTAQECEMELGFKNPPETRIIKIGKVDETVNPEDLVTREEKNKLMKACTNFRDKALIDVVDDSGLRPSELLELQIKNVKQDKYGYTLIVKKESKTGSREVRILEATPTLMEWLNTHPYFDNPEAPLFVNLGNRNYGKAYEYWSAADMLSELCKKAGIRHLNLYLFRHTETTRRIDSLNEYDNKLRHGHSKDSRAHQKYIHITAKKADERFLKSYGLEPEEQEDLLPIVCKSCKRPNSRDRDVCYCGRALSIEAAVMLEKKESEQVETLQKQFNELATTVMPFLKDLAVLRSAAEKQNGNELTTIPLKHFSEEAQQQLEQRLNRN